MASETTFNISEMAAELSRMGIKRLKGTPLKEMLWLPHGTVIFQDGEDAIFVAPSMVKAMGEDFEAAIKQVTKIIKFPKPQPIDLYFVSPETYKQFYPVVPVLPINKQS